MVAARRSGYIWLGLLWLWLAVYVIWLADDIAQRARIGVFDFHIFLDSARALLAGQSPYAVSSALPLDRGGWANFTNLNVPAGVLLFLPFAPLPDFVAFLVWEGLSLACYAAAIALTCRELHLSPLRRTYLATLAFLAPGLFVSFVLGQVTAPLTLGVVGIWLLLRRDRWIAAGVLCSAQIVLKPFLAPLLALWLVRRQWTGLLASAGGAGLALALPLPIVGIGAYRDYARTIGVAARFGVTSHLALTVLAFVLALAAFPVILRPAPFGLLRVDRDVIAVIAISILASPLGWGYYQTLLLPAIGLACAILPPVGGRNRLAVAALVALFFVAPLARDAATLALVASRPRRRVRTDSVCEGGRPSAARDTLRSWNEPQ